MKGTLFPALCTLALCWLTPNASAREAGLSSDTLYIDIRLNVGTLSGKAGEYVYDPTGTESGIPGYKISQLNWTLEAVPMLGVGLSISPGKRLRFNFDYQRNIIDGKSTMDDYDWMYVGLDWSHWSHHDNTTVNRANNIDLNGEITLLQLNRSKDAVTLLLGYKRSHIGWVARGGYGIYSDIEKRTYRDILLYFPPSVKGISYEQIFKLPYIGVGLHLTGRKDTTLTARLRYSNRVSGEAIDYHHLRNLRFDEYGERGTWHALDLKAAIPIDRQLTLDISYTFEHHQEIKTMTVITDLLTGDKTVYPQGSGGMDRQSSLFAVGITGRF